MIPHHSSAVITSGQVDFDDRKVKKLSEQIIRAQEKEIAEMERMIKKLRSGTP